MSQLLNRVRDVDPNDSEAVKEVLTAFFQKLSKHKDIDNDPYLRAGTLEYIINRFPKYCGQHRAMIENYLSLFLDSSNYYNVIEAAKCAHAVQQVRPQQEKTASAKSCWREQMNSLCDAAHTLMDTLFVRSASIHNKNSKSLKNASQSLTSPLQVALADIEVINSEDVANKSNVLSTRLRNVLVFIQAMLVEVYPVAKPIRPQLVLEVILQALSASGNEDSAKVTAVKLQALRTLDAIVACLGSNLIPFSALVFRFVMQTLKWSEEHVSKETRSVRSAAYSSLSRWLHTLRTQRARTDARARSWHDQLTAHVLGDVTPHAHLVQLTSNGTPMKNLSKKARKKLANSMLMQSNISSHMPGEKNKIKMSEESNDEVAIAALECAETFFTTCGIFLKETIHKQFQELLVRECYNIDSYSPERGICLVRALEACRKSCSTKVPPPTQYCIQLYSVLINNAQPEISKFSSQALLDIRMHLHCSPPSLNFALQAQPDSKKDDKRKRLSERNRAALESLLGKERLPLEDITEEEIITIPDEPTTKRQRINEDTDKISLSSESVASVDISDSSSVEEVNETELNSNETERNIESDVLNTELEFQPTQIYSQFIAVDEENNEQMDETDGQVNDDDAEIQLSQIPVPDTDSGTDTSLRQDDIFGAKTQMPRVETIEKEKSPPLSMEVAYDYPNTGQEKVTVLDKMDEDNLPSTNDTDDVQITCGQTVKSSQELEFKELETEAPTNNGIDKSPEPIIENGVAGVDEIEGNVAVKIVSNDVEVTVEDMLADFVDEVNDEIQIAA